MVSRRKGPLRAWRIADKRHPIFDGTGARIYGARWNSPGREVIYASASYGCAILERLVHAGIGAVPRNQASVLIEIPKIDIEEVGQDDVRGWDHADFVASRAYGDLWVAEKRSAVLLVPSIVARGDLNVLINPAHPDFRKIRCGEPELVIWDVRLFRK